MATPSCSVETGRQGGGSHPEKAQPAGLETRLVAEAKEGSRVAFERLYRMHVGGVYALCLRMVADAERAEGLTQDVFVRVWQKLPQFAGRGSFGGWVRKLATHLIIDAQRSRVRHSQWLDAGTDVDTLGESTSPGEAIDLERAIAGLPPGARAAFVLHDVYGYTHGEIGAMTSIAEGTAKAQLHRARRLLRAVLGPAEEA